MLRAYPLETKEVGGKMTIAKVNGQPANEKDLPLLMRHHPFREEGGIFIYPSMHFVLSRHKYLRPSFDYQAIPTAFDPLTRLPQAVFAPPAVLRSRVEAARTRAVSHSYSLFPRSTKTRRLGALLYPWAKMRIRC